MLEILQFIFSSFWIWLGFTINLYIIVRLLLVAVVGMIAAKTDDNENNTPN